MLKYIIEQMPGFISGALVSGIVCVLSSKYLGWFNKEIKSLETKVGDLPKP